MHRNSRCAGRSGIRRVGTPRLDTPGTLPTAASHPPGIDCTMLILGLLAGLLSRRCAACGTPGDDLCHRCRFSLASAQVADHSPLRSPAGIRAAFAFEGVARELIVALKFRHARSAAGVLAAQMVRRLRLEHIDVVTWAPTSARRVRRRGYDQAEAIARAIARQLGVPCRRLLYRAHGDPQTGKSRIDRLAGPAFRARRPRDGLTVLVVDDVVTTGATLLTAAEALRAAGVARVELVAAVSAQLSHPLPRPRLSISA
jgi:ComF family protein